MRLVLFLSSLGLVYFGLKFLLFGWMFMLLIIAGVGGLILSVISHPLSRPKCHTR